MVKLILAVTNSWKQVVDVADVVRHLVDVAFIIFLFEDRAFEEAASFIKKRFLRRTGGGLWLLDVVELEGFDAAPLKVTNEMKRKKRLTAELLERLLEWSEWSPKDSTED